MRRPRSPYLKLARLIEDEGFEHREFAQTGGCQHLQNGGFDFHAVSPFSTAGKKYSPICSCGM